MQGVILAAGHGSRLQPITLTRSKAMVPILGRPIVERVMQDLIANEIDDIVVVVSPDDRYITRYFRHECEIEAELRFVYQPERLGMANALSCAAPLLSGDFIPGRIGHLLHPDCHGDIDLTRGHSQVSRTKGCPTRAARGFDFNGFGEALPDPVGQHAAQ